MSRMLDEAEWPSWICEDLEGVLKALGGRHGSRVSGVHADLKAASAEVYLAEDVPEGALELLRGEFATNARLRFAGGSAACLEHYCSIRLRAPAESTTAARGGVRRAVREFIARVVKAR